MPVDLLTDPVVRRFTTAEFHGWMLGLADVARYETDGIYAYVGEPPEFIQGLIDKGGLIPVESEPGVERFEVYAWSVCVKTKEAMDKARAEAKERKERWKAKQERQPERVPNASGSNSSSPSSSKDSKGSQPKTVTRRRDEAYEALADWWYEREGAWKGLPSQARGRLNQALKQLRDASANEGVDLAAEIRIRGDRARRLQPEWTWTPQTLVDYWPKLAVEPVGRTNGKPARGANEHLAQLADRLESR